MQKPSSTFLKLIFIMMMGTTGMAATNAHGDVPENKPLKNTVSDTLHARDELTTLINAHYESMEKMAVMMVKLMNTPGIDRQSPMYDQANKLFLEVMKNLKTRDRAMKILMKMDTPSADIHAATDTTHIWNQKKIFTH